MHSDDNPGRNSPVDSHPSHLWERTIFPLSAPPDAMEDMRTAMDHPAYTLSNQYDPRWIVGNAMGPIPTWQVEALAPSMHFEPGQRVLDLGCGAAVTSIFMAREYGVHVTAADLWIDPSDNASRVAEARCADMVTPVRAEAHTLPFAHGWFDAIVAFDSYHYFGTDVRYLSYLAQFVKPGGRIGIVVPGNAVDPDEPEAIAPHQPLADELGADWYSWRSAEWWRRHWSRTACVDVELSEMLEGGWADWLRQCDAIDAYNPQVGEWIADRAMLQCEAGQTLGFCKVVARRNDNAALNFGPGEFETRIA